MRLDLRSRAHGQDKILLLRGKKAVPGRGLTSDMLAHKMAATGIRIRGTLKSTSEESL